MQKIRIDFDNPGLPQHISAVENDSQSRFFQATLYENGKAYTAPEGATYSIMYRGFGPQNQGWYDTINDGAGKRAACAVSGNVITCEIARQALQVPGHVSIVLCVTTGKGYMLKSWPIECDCKNDRYDSTAEIQSFFYITQVSNADWNRAIQALEELKNTIDPTLSVSGKAADAAKVGEAVNAESERAKGVENQLKEDLADYEDALDIKLYKASLAENPSGVGLNWNLYYDVSIPAGTKVIVTLNSYSGTLFINMNVSFFDASGNMKKYGSIKSIGGTMVITTTDDYTRLWLQINRSAIENGVNVSVTFATNRSGVFKALTDLENSLDEKINAEILKASIVHTFHVEKDGTGDFTKLIDAIDEAEKYMDSVVYVGDGEWNIIDELGSDYLNSVSFAQRGIVLKNRINLVFSSKSKVICDYSGDNTTIKNWLSPFNAGKHGFTLENLNIYSHNVRYSMHDERDSDGDFYINRYINCHFFNHDEKGGFRQCIGGGLGKNGYIVIENCIFENPKASNNSLVSYHNTANVGGGSAKSNIEVSNCYVKGTGTLRFSWYGTSTDTTIVKATGNNLGSAIQFIAETSDGTSPNENVELYEWNNIIRSN